ncbi:MAG: PIN domain-containing protein [candidate division WWE3 bacterium]|nr:PIN domain-containing protein [candidate division WWE3 bacterium]
MTVTSGFFIGFYISSNLLFNNFHLLNIRYLGPTIIGGLLAAAIFVWLPNAFIYLRTSVTNFFTHLITQTMAEFFREQNRRLTESRGLAEKAKAERLERRKVEALMRVAQKESQAAQKAKLDELCGLYSGILDTSALIDGRIWSIVQSGFWVNPLVIPQCVIDELQHLADNSDKLKRERGRYGLSILNELTKYKDIRTTIVNNINGAEDHDPVDKRLVILAKNLKGRLITVDFNLNKVAKAHGVKVLNVNELANGLRTVFFPGEKHQIKVVNVGKDVTQGVGYLQDGTMIVIEAGASQVGQDVEIEITRSLQTQAGKMFFGKIATP